jgi:outer membrane protein W
VRKTFSLGKRVHPYFALGPELVHGSYQLSQNGTAQPLHSDTGLGLYGRAGVYFDLGEHWSLGLDLHELFFANADLSGVDSDFDDRQLALTIGYSF